VSAPVWLGRLLRPGRLIGPLPGRPGWYGVFPGGDRRRRCEAKLSADTVRDALSQGLIQPVEGEIGRFEPAPEATLRVRRESLPEPVRFTAQHRRVEARAVMTPKGAIATAAALEDFSYLARHARSGRLSPVQLAAAERLKRDYERSSLVTQLTCDWTRGPGAPGGGRGRDPADAPAAAMDARTRVLDALAAVGPGLDRVLTALILRERGVEETERSLGWPKRSGLAALRLALDRMAVHYGMACAAPPAAILSET